MDSKDPGTDLQQVFAIVANTTGLEFPSSRRADLQRGIAAAAKELGFKTTAEYLSRLLSGLPGQKELDSLVNHLTVGETYFFRDKRSFDVLAEQILPALIRAGRNGDRKLRIWSAACCTGEEPYTIAIVLRRMIPDWKNWDITVLATDINSRFLQKAMLGEFGPWSFRDAPTWLRGDFFRPTHGGRFEILPEIKQIVKFARLNLADDSYPSVATDTNAMDVIFCRNVLMYFGEAQARKVIQRMYRAQAEGGCLFVGPGELSSASCAPYAGTNSDGVTFYRKSGELPRVTLDGLEAAASLPLMAIESFPQYSDSPPERPSNPVETPTPDQMAVSLANQGKLASALEYCDQWIAIERLNASSHCLRAVILQEQGLTEEALRSLRTALYLDPNCVRAHFAMGNIAIIHGQWREANRHLTNARKLLRRFNPDEPLPEFEGVTAGRFLQIIDSLIEMEAVA